MKFGVYYFYLLLNLCCVLWIFYRNMGKEEELLRIVYNNDEKKLQVNLDLEVGGIRLFGELIIYCMY